MDTLVHAQEKYQAAISAGAVFDQALQQMADAAEEGKESTRNLVAKIGRASRLGERSRGTLDAGATSCALILGTFAKVLSGT
jgi:dihydroxyacetone kinase-like protein